MSSYLKSANAKPIYIAISKKYGVVSYSKDIEGLKEYSRTGGYKQVQIVPIYGSTFSNIATFFFQENDTLRIRKQKFGFGLV